MNYQPIYRNGEQATITPAGVLVICGNALATGEMSTPEDMQFCRGAIDGILAAARAGGCTQCDILETLLARGKLAPRIGAMARDACDAAGTTALRQLFDRIGLVAEA